MKPKVSIVIPIYNGEQFIQECINSILEQSYSDYEIIIINDASTDNTYEKLLEIAKLESRIQVINNCTHNMVDSLNLGIKKSQGIYIARMDIDDKMNPNRLQEQVKLMDLHPEVIVCSSWARCFGNCTNPMHGFSGKIEFPLVHFLYGNYIIHPSVMIKKDFLIKNRIRYKQRPYAEDYQIWIDIAKCGGNFWILPMELIQYRVSDTQVSHTFHDIQLKTASDIQNKLLKFLIKKNYFPDNSFKKTISKLIDYNEKGFLNDTTIYSMCAEIIILYNLQKNNK